MRRSCRPPGVGTPAGSSGTLQHLGEPPALELRQRTGLHDPDPVAHLGVVLGVVDVELAWCAAPSCRSGGGGHARSRPRPRWPASCRTRRGPRAPCGCAAPRSARCLLRRPSARSSSSASASSPSSSTTLDVVDLVVDGLDLVGRRPRRRPRRAFGLVASARRAASASSPALERPRPARRRDGRAAATGPASTPLGHGDLADRAGSVSIRATSLRTWPSRARCCPAGRWRAGSAG